MRSLLKGSVLGLSALFASAAMACPDLSGSFICDGEALVISQELGADNVTTYYINGGQAVLRADGVSRQVVTGDESVPMVNESYTCAGDKLVNLVAGDVVDGGNKIGQLTVNTDYFISGTGLSSEYKGNVVMNDGQVHPIEGAWSCTRN